MKNYSLNNKIVSSLGKEKLLSFAFSFFINILEYNKITKFSFSDFFVSKNNKF